MEIPEKMKAVVLMGPNKLEIKEVDTPRTGPQDVLIKVQATAVCSSDVSLIAKPWEAQPPYGSFIIGHEYAGIVAAVGDTVDEFSVGDRVAVEASYGCGRCRNCRLGNYTACLNYGNLKRGHRANGFTTNGGFAQYALNQLNTVYKIPDSIEFDEAALITNLGCVLYGFQTTGGYIVGDDVAIIGPGPLGLISASVARALCAERIFLIGTRSSRLETGKSIGADRIINVHDEDPVKVVREETGGKGADLVIESSGAPTGIQTAVEMCKRMGKVLLLGYPEEPASLNFAMMGMRNIHIFSVRGEGWANCARGISLLSQGKVTLKPLATHSFPLDQVEEAFRTFTERIGGAIKVIVHPNE
ncbi:MAG: alcohol dehydrogenase catalytic domain-containing protein [Deltaproteobacteria bacterium]|nr:alcohol dehydrogenase catalytic domain-containing protein [Deltaproteobacteria bacterium]MBW1934218.1 alcohol dehydrogenase catalytic domain-containing protein [Deltaproteobacteria bacterium]MBW1976483.1 alcohol dehydrogenase catalytic domain-containing protein [Deltaproteobacteria bacterium]MBW2044242.1 alcohol dehydrogenase catalytic domain-containing protein [Deltaproteobacteria bacterium]MBW2299860.1 alcohol dehydrogenase catalytic domain-containing protein [Deltaproteobacteria bacterium